MFYRHCISGSFVAEAVRVMEKFRAPVWLFDSVSRLLVKFSNSVSSRIVNWVAKHYSSRAEVSFNLLLLAGMSWMALMIGPTPAFPHIHNYFS